MNANYCDIAQAFHKLVQNGFFWQLDESEYGTKKASLFTKDEHTVELLEALVEARNYLKKMDVSEDAISVVFSDMLYKRTCYVKGE